MHELKSIVLSPFVVFLKRIKNNKHIRQYLNNPSLRIKVSLYSSLLINTSYAAFQLVLGIYHCSFWFYAISVYYIMLAVIRFFLLRDIRTLKPGENRRNELVRYRFCGIILLFMNIVLVFLVFYITSYGKGAKHHLLTTAALAIYTLGSLTRAVVNVIRYRKYNRPIFSAAKAISLAAAAVSVLSLESAVIGSISKMATLNTGSVVCTFIFAMAIYMIYKSTKEIKTIDDSRKH